MLGALALTIGGFLLLTSGWLTEGTWSDMLVYASMVFFLLSLWMQARERRRNARP